MVEHCFVLLFVHLRSDVLPSVQTGVVLGLLLHQLVIVVLFRVVTVVVVFVATAVVLLVLLVLLLSTGLF